VIQNGKRISRVDLGTDDNGTANGSLFCTVRRKRQLVQ